MTDLQSSGSSDPDFVALYEPHLADGAAMTPRMAYWLWETAWFLADTWRLIADDDFFATELPRVAAPYAKGEWLAQFIGCFQHLAERIAEGDGDSALLARCTGDELALHMTIDLARDHLNDEVIDIEAAADLPDHGDKDSNFGLIRDVLFADHDVLMLYEPSLDGIEDDEFSRGSNLHPRDWFKPFRPT